MPEIASREAKLVIQFNFGRESAPPTWQSCSRVPSPGDLSDKSESAKVEIVLGIRFGKTNADSSRIMSGRPDKVLPFCRRSYSL